MSEEYPVLQELETKLKLLWVDTDDVMATQRAIVEVSPDHAYLELPRGRKGDKGDPGPAISMQGIVADDSQLPVNARVGHAYVNTSTRGLAVWNGAQWFKVDNFAGVEADVQQFSQWFAQIESDTRRAVDAAERAEFAAEETIQQIEGDFATRNYVDSALTIVSDGGMLFTADNFAPIPGAPTYSETPTIPLRGMKYVYVRGSTQETTQEFPIPLITGYRADGTSQVIYDSGASGFLGNRPSVLADLFPIPDEYTEVKVRLYNASHEKYQVDLPPMVMVALSPGHVADYLESVQSYEHNTAFPNARHAVTYTTSYNTGHLVTYPGMSVEYEVNVSGEAGAIHEWGKDAGRIGASAGTITFDGFGVLALSTFNPTHAIYDPDFYAYYAVTKTTKTTDSEELASPTLGEYLPTPTLKAVRHANFLDGTSKTAIQYLWADQHNNFYVSSTLRGEKRKIFTFKSSDFGGTTPENWSMGFDKFGNILCVFRTEQLPWVVNDNIRRNPILLVRDQGYKPVVIDFGTNLKPSNWLQDCGFLATDDYVMITEYTRPNVTTANTWRVTYPISDPANWQVVQSWPVVLPFKHIHNVDRDPYTGHVYTSTGDVDEAAGIYASMDGGNTFTTILDGSEKYCRVLNFVFTKDWIYWATDSSGNNHFLFRAPRGADGVMDTANIEDIIKFPMDSPPTYATIHLPKIDALLFLNRSDGKTTTLPVDLWDLRSSRMIRLDSIPAVGGVPDEIGFRCETFTYVPRGNEVAVGFSNTTGQGGYRSLLGLLGNTTSPAAKIQNLIMTVERIPGVGGDDFTISYDTSVI